MSLERLGTGPVFAFEWLLATRKWQVYALRSFFVGVLLVSIGLSWLSATDAMRYRSGTRVMAEMGQTIFGVVACVQLALVMLAAPAATAGAICLDKARGTLLHLLATDLSDTEIVLGKLAARLIPVIGMVGCVFPVLAIVTLLGGIDPQVVTGTFVVTLGLAVLGCALALLLSVWAGKTHEVVMLVYIIWVVWLLLWPVLMSLEAWLFPMRRWGSGWIAFNGWIGKTNPFWITFGPLARGGPFGTPTLADQIGFLAGTLVVSAILVLAAIRMVRGTAIAQANRPRKGARSRRSLREFLGRFLPGPSLDFNPVLWREWHRNRPSRMTRVVWTIYTLSAGTASFVAIYHLFNGAGGWREFATMVNVFQLGFGMLMLSVLASTSLAEERVRGSLDVLLATPLPTRSILVGKWLGAYRLVPWLLVLPSLVVFCAVLRSGHVFAAALLVASVLAQGATITSVGIGLATWTPRLGRAVGLTVTVYILLAVVWLFLVIALFPRGPSDFARGLAMFSPLFSTGTLSAVTEDRNNFGSTWQFNSQAFGLFWTIVYAALALGLFGATLIGFNKALGRMDEGPSGPPLPHPSPAAWPARQANPELVFEET